MPSLSTVLVSDNETMDTGFNVYLTDTSSNSVTLTLPAIDGADGTHFFVRNIDTSATSNTTTIVAASGETIEQASSYVLPTGTTIHILAFGTNWYLID